MNPRTNSELACTQYFAVIRLLCYGCFVALGENIFCQLAGGAGGAKSHFLGHSGRMGSVALGYSLDQYQVQYSTVQYSTVQYSTVQVQSSTVPGTAQNCTVLYIVQ
jgi:hypothetical protein